MHDREPLIAVATTSILVVIWFSGMLMSSQHFAGTALGGMLAIIGGLLLMSPLLYYGVKRIPALKVWVSKRMPVRTILVWHIYASYLGVILVLLHTGHKFNSTLAAFLTGSALLLVLSGIVGRYLQKQIGDDLRSKRKALSNLYAEYDQLSRQNLAVSGLSLTAGRYERLHSLVIGSSISNIAHVANLATSISDTESSITYRESLKRWFTRWYKVHCVLAIAMYTSLILHIWSGVHFGLRWFS